VKEQLKKADVLGLLIIAAALISYSVRSIWSTYQTIAVIAGGLLVVVSLAVKLPDIRRGLGRRSARFGINSAASVVLFLGILAFVNYLGAQHVKRVDMTTEKIYSLSDQSVNVAQQINQDLHIRAFYPGGDYAPARDLLDLYRDKNKRISFEFIDPDKQPQLAAQYGVTAYGDFSNPMTGESFRYGTLILEMGDKKERIEKQSEPLREEDFTNALTKIAKGQKKTIYFTEGHGEKGIDNTDRTGYSLAKAQLENENYVVKTVNLVRVGKVPEDAAVLVIAGATAEPFANELDSVDGYLKNGGSVLVLLDPAPAASLAELLQKWSIDVGNNVVLDPTGLGRLLGMGPAAPLAANYGANKITERMRTMTFFPMARSVSPAATPAEGITTEKLIQTNERSWGETNTKNNEAQFDDKIDLKGPISLATVATKNLGDKKEMRLVVYGDSDFATNVYYQQAANGNLFMNTVSWLAQDENFISIRPKDPEDRRLTMTEAQGRMVSYVSLLLLPVSILVAGVSVWMKRRR
jgi:ABC-type uncharacterized transport system involved in gliding motility auxiliary subunit